MNTRAHRQETYSSKSSRKHLRDTGHVSAVHRSTAQESEDAETYIHTGSNCVPRDIDWCDIAVQRIDKCRNTRRLKKQANRSAEDAAKPGLLNEGQSTSKTLAQCS
ncbi:hypothetical protein [Sphingomonas faeni]|uniref:hypothetical protein n=1 Tax=Sphingomonas faeni TaxID=185950 RepID=UPI0027875037|nr:hypothetical protein [Sphingomonas faeni]MDQ0840279.1 hypothetical protein [Sphingomonas faeni]